MKKTEKKTKARPDRVSAAREKRYLNLRTWAAAALLPVILIVFVAVVAGTRMQLTDDQLFATNRTRMQTVIGGLDAGMSGQGELGEEYDRLYAAKLKNVQYYFGSLGKNQLDNSFCRRAAEYADMDSVAVIDSSGTVYGAWNCPYDFTRTRFRMLRACAAGDGASEPFSMETAGSVRRFFGKRIAEDRILVFAADWTDTARNIENMTSWEAVLRGMVSVDTVSVAVSLKDYTFLYNPIDDLTGKDALQNGVPIESLGESWEGELTFGGDRWCVVGRQWHDAVVFVMTRARTDFSNDMILIIFLTIVFGVFMFLISVYGTIINRDNIRVGKLPRYVTLLSRKAPEGRRHILNFNLTVAAKVLPITLVGILAVTGFCYYVQSVNALSSIAYESNMAISEISVKLENNTADAAAVNTEYKDMFMEKCVQISRIVEAHPENVLTFDPESENVHRQPLGINDAGEVVSGLDSHGNVSYSVSEQPFLKELCDVNAIEKISLFDEYGRILATNDTGWYYVISGNEGAQSYPFWEILAEHRDAYAQDLTVDEEGAYSQYIGTACSYYTMKGADGQTEYVDRDAYEKQLRGVWDGPEIVKHRGMLQISIAPERLRSVSQTATLTYVADHTSIHGTGHAVICDSSDDHLCVYSPNETDIGKSAASMGYSPLAFSETGEMYNGFETVGGERYFQTFKRSGDYRYYIGTAVPLGTVYATREALTLTVLALSSAAFLLLFLYACTFGVTEEALYRENAGDAESRARNEQDLITVTMPSGKTRRVRTAASRWDAEYVPWQQKTPEQKFAQVAKIVFYGFSFFLFACILLSRAGVVSIDMINYVYEGVWTKGFNIFAMTNCVITLIMVVVVAKLAELLIDNLCVNIGSRAETLGHLFSSVIRYGVALFSVFYTLYLCGLDTGSLIASAGIMSLVIGLGAQSMIQDILAGVFIVFEGAFRVGDIVTIGDFRGNVLEIGLRTTKIEDVSKNIKVFNNSTLSGIINMTKEASFAGVDVGVEYGEDIERVEAVLKRELPGVARRLPAIMDGPFYRGVSALADSSVTIKIVAMCKEQDRLQLCRDLNREVLLIFKRNDINVPFPQVTLSYLEKKKADGHEETR